MKTYTFRKRVIAFLLCIAMVAAYLPGMVLTASAAAGTDDSRVVDPHTLNQWQKYFGLMDGSYNNVELTTEYAGGVWTDKSVFSAASLPALLTGPNYNGKGIQVTDKGDNFVVALSAMASNKEIVGYSTVPTDTIMVLDLSSSMRSNDDNGGSAIDELVEATNSAITALLRLNKNNRVAVVLFAGNTSGSFNNNPGTTTVVLPLDTYTPASDGTFLESVTVNRNPDYGIRVRNGVQGSSGTVTGNMNTSSGTFTQDGIYEAMKLFLNVEDTKVETGVQAGTGRLPIMVLMTDGEPTMANHDYNGNNAGTDLGNSDIYLQFNGRDYNHRDTIAWMTQLTAAYAKREISQHYQTDALFYTLAFGEESDSLAEAKSVMDPANTSPALNGFWNDFLAGRAVTVFTYTENRQTRTLTASNDTAEPLTAADKLYVDKPFKADGTTGANGLYNVFAEIVNEIIVQSKYYPTYVETDHDHDGYLTMVDKIGTGMEVTNINGIIIGDRLFSGEAIAKALATGDFGSIANPNNYGHELVGSVKERLGIADTAVAQTLLQNAYDHGQLSYDARTGAFSNYIGWFSDSQGNYLDFWHEGMTREQVPAGATHVIKSYGFLGDTTDVPGVSNTDMMYMSVRISTALVTGESIVTWQIPASLVPTVTYEVEVEVTDEGEITNLLGLNLAADSAESPIRLVYEVALKDDIYDWNVAQKAQKDANGNYVFYTNKWNADPETTTENTYSHFEPSVENERYYYTEKTTVLVKNGNTYTPYTGAKPTGGSYYRSYMCFEKLTNGDLRTHLHYEPISAQAMESVEADGTGWVIPKGVVHRYYDFEITDKADNATGTMAHSDHPFVVKEADHYYTYSTQGNNGKLTLTPATGIKVTKELAEGYTSSATFTFQVTGNIANAQVVRLTADGKEASRTALAADGKFTLQAGESVYVLGLTGQYSISEVIPADADYTVAAIRVDGVSHTGTSVDVTLTAQTITDVVFTNDARGTGNLYIIKEIVSDHDLPASVAGQTFQVRVNVGAELSGKTFKVVHGNVEQNALVDGSGYLKVAGADLSVPRDVAYEILGLPTGTQVTVEEILSDTQDDYFTATIRTRDHTGATQDNDGAVVIHKNGNATAVLSNTYVPVPVAVELDVNGTKNFIVDSPLGAPLSFDFAVQRWDGAAWQTISGKTAAVSTTGGTENFTITDVLSGEVYDTVGAYAYQVVEVIPDVKADGVVYDRTLYTFTVTVTDAGGNLQAVVTDHEGTTLNGNYPVSFTNNYHTAPVSVDVQKTVINNTGNLNATAAGFTIVATETDSTFTTALGSYSEVTDGAGHVRFAGFYDVAGDRYYTVRESIPAGAQLVTDGTHAGKYHLNGWYYDPTVYYIHVSVTTLPSGDLTAAIAYGTDPAALTGTADNALLAFENTYEPAQAEVDLDLVPTVLKELVGRDLEDGEFTFYVTENGNHSNILLTGTNDAQGNVNFGGTLKFSAIGTYHFDVLEKQESKGGVTYDKTVYDMVAEVTDNGSGTLSAIYYFEDSITGQVTFRNRYTATPVEHTISAVKSLSGRPLLNGEFRFLLEEAVDAQGTLKQNGLVLRAENGPAANNNAPIHFATQTYNTAGTYYYKLTEIPGAAGNGITYSRESYVYMVKVVDNSQGALVVEEAKVVSYNGSSANLPNEVTFTNTYKALAGQADFGGRKELTGRVLGAGEFTFVITQTRSDFETVVSGGYTATVNNTADGKISFGTVEYHEEGTYYYLVTEDASAGLGGITYDESAYLVTVTVTDNHAGRLIPVVTIQKKTVTDEGSVVQPASSIVFQNYYDVAPDVVEITGTKAYIHSLTNLPKDMQADQFTFKLEGNDQELYAKNDANGNFKFQLGFTSDDIGNEYTYTLSEVEGNVPYITYDPNTYVIKIKVEDDGLGGLKITKTIEGSQQIHFENRYNVTGSADVTLEGTKLYTDNVTGNPKDLPADTFQFNLSGEGRNETVSNLAGGAFSFSTITYTAADIRNEAYVYTVTEVAGDKDYITYDADVYTVSVLVSDDGMGGIRVEKAVVLNSNATANDILFDNYYDVVSPGSVEITGTKTYVGKELADGQFTFKLEGNGDELFATNDANGSFSFKLTYTAADIGSEYTYTVSEVAGSEAYITYDADTYVVKVKIEDNGEGGLKVTKTQEAEIAFENTYNPGGSAEVVVEGTKTYVGKELVDGQFTFKLEGSGDELFATNDANGSFSFKLTYTAADIGNEYTYTVSEVAGDKTCITYDADTYVVKVKVEDDGQGGLKVTKTQEAEIAFENTYNLTGTAELVLEGTKTLSGRDLVDGEFTFGLFQGDKQVSVASNKDGKFVLKATYTAADLGEYTYTVVETQGEAAYVTYDKTVYTVKVKVSDNGQGGIAVEHTLVDAEKIAFTNLYEPVVDIPQTGDSFQLGMFLSLMILSSFGIAALTVCKKKEEKAN